MQLVDNLNQSIIAYHVIHQLSWHRIQSISNSKTFTWKTHQGQQTSLIAFQICKLMSLSDFASSIIFYLDHHLHLTQYFQTSYNCHFPLVFYDIQPVTQSSNYVISKCPNPLGLLVTMLVISSIASFVIKLLLIIHSLSIF